jgi:conjugative transfer signal peptidase TraF
VKPRFDRLRWPMLALSMVIAGGVVAKEAGWRVNITGSLPGVFYRVSEDPARGDYFQFCPPFTVPAIPDAKPGEPSCNGKVPLIKRVVAVAGDRVVVDWDGVTINGERLENSAPKRFARDGSALQTARGVHVLEPGQVWVAGEHPDSFDSRYFGPVSLKLAMVKSGQFEL